MAACSAVDMFFRRAKRKRILEGKQSLTELGHNWSLCFCRDRMFNVCNLLIALDKWFSQMQVLFDMHSNLILKHDVVITPRLGIIVVKNKLTTAA